MNSAILTTRPTPANTLVLNKLAERWRAAGLFLACYDRAGNLLWHDSQMPRILSLCLTCESAFPRQISNIPEGPQLQVTCLEAPIPGLHACGIPVARRRRLSSWIVILARAEDLAAGEDLARLAGQASLDVMALLQQSAHIPALNAPHFAALVSLAEQMHEDLQAAAVLHNETSSVTEQLTAVYEEISLLYKISSGMRFSQKPQSFLESVCREVQEIGNFRAVAVAFASREEESAAPQVGELAVLVGAAPLPGPELLAGLRGPILEALSSGETQIQNSLPEEAQWNSLRSALTRFVCVPLERDHRPLGIMLALDKNEGTDFDSVDLKLLNNVGNQCSIFMENAALYQDMQGLFMGVLHALTRSIDAKDAYTRGHSQRVAELSRELARRMGLPDEQCERVYLSGLLHDVGKIGVPEAVLTKPGRLTDAEFDAIKKHPEIGAQILGNIKQLQDIIPGVLYHHERWDGRGYPYQIGGEEIPLIGRIICVADSFDAMSSTRTYRPALPLETVLAEIQRCAGTQFDPTLARLFATLDFTHYLQAMEDQTAILKDAALPRLGALP
jgi:putative nucleotidyltransferase with HDIG domain